MESQHKAPGREEFSLLLSGGLVGKRSKAAALKTAAYSCPIMTAAIYISIYIYNSFRTAADPAYASPLQTVHGPGSQQRCAQGQDVLVEHHLRIVHGLTVAGILLR